MIKLTIWIDQESRIYLKTYNYMQQLLIKST